MQQEMPHYALVIRGATVITADPGQAPITDAVIAVQGDVLRRICAADAFDAHFTADRILDLPGRVIIPGLFNVHTHAILSMVRGVAEDLLVAERLRDPGRRIPERLEIARRRALIAGR